MPGMLEPKLAPLIAAGLPKDLIPVIAKYAAGGEIARFLKGIPQLPEQAVTMILTATSDSLNEAIKKGYISMVPIAAIGFLVALFIKHEPFKKDEAAMKLEQ